MVDIAMAQVQERGEVVAFMQSAFPRAKWGLDGWQRLLARRWAKSESFAVTVRDGPKLIGVLGLVRALRPTASGLARTANMTSWYVLKDYRGQGIGQKMIAAATAALDVTVTNFSSAKGAVSAVKQAGMVELDTHRRVWWAGAASGLRVSEDPLALHAALSEADRQVIEDHAGLNLKPLSVETPDGPCTMILSVKQKLNEYVTHEVMYLGQPNVFAAHSRAIAGAVLPSDRAVLSVDARFLPEDIECDATEAFAVPRFYSPGRLSPEAVDMLYSEIVLLDMKLY